MFDVANAYGLVAQLGLAHYHDTLNLTQLLLLIQTIPNRLTQEVSLTKLDLKQAMRLCASMPQTCTTCVTRMPKMLSSKLDRRSSWSSNGKRFLIAIEKQVESESLIIVAALHGNLQLRQSGRSHHRRFPEIILQSQRRRSLLTSNK